MRPRLLRVLLVVLLLLVSAGYFLPIRSPVPPVAVESGVDPWTIARYLAIGELQWKMRGTPPAWEPITESTVEVRDEPSRVLPAVTYRWVSYTYPEIVDPSVITAVSAVSPGRVVLVNGADAWSLAAAGWYPANEDDALAGCDEMLHAVHTTLTGTRVTTAVDREDFRMFLDPQPSAFRARVLTAPVVHRPQRADGRWVVEIWTIGTGNAIRRRCTFPAGPAAQGRVGIATLDSVPLPLPFYSE